MTYGIKASSKEHDVKTAPWRDLTFTSEKGCFKLKEILSNSKTASVGRNHWIFAHNQDHRPAVIVWIKIDNSQYLSPNLRSDSEWTHSVDSSNIHFYFDNKSGGNISFSLKILIKLWQ